jgi:hypothetical protein
VTTCCDDLVKNSADTLFVKKSAYAVSGCAAKNSAGTVRDLMEEKVDKEEKDCREAEEPTHTTNNISYA